MQLFHIFVQNSGPVSLCVHVHATQSMVLGLTRSMSFIIRLLAKSSVQWHVGKCLTFSFPLVRCEMGGEFWFLAFADCNAINAPTWLISSYPYDITERGAGEHVHNCLTWARASWLQHSIAGSLSLPRLAKSEPLGLELRSMSFTKPPRLLWCSRKFLKCWWIIMEVSRCLVFLQRWSTVNENTQMSNFAEATNDPIQREYW